MRWLLIFSLSLLVSGAHAATDASDRRAMAFQQRAWRGDFAPWRGPRIQSAPTAALATRGAYSDAERVVRQNLIAMVLRGYVPLRAITRHH